MNKTIGIFAHVDAGKTTFSESLLYNAKAIKNRGRVDHQNTLLDYHEVEKERGITVFSGVAHFKYKESTYFLIDTPGHVDFSSEMERTISVMDAAVIIISGLDGVQAHTYTVWNLLREKNIPTLFFINKLDCEGVELDSIMLELKNKLSSNLIYLHEDQSDEDWIEMLATQDEELLELYLNGNDTISPFETYLSTAFSRGDIFPCFSGSALQNIGIEFLLSKLDNLLITNYDESKPFAGRVYQVRIDEKGNPVAFIKAISGSLSVRETIRYGADHHESKVNQLRIYKGHKFEHVQSIKAGEIFGATGLSTIVAGDGVGELFSQATSSIIPTLRVEVIGPKHLHTKELLGIFKNLEIENPTLQVKWNETLQVIHIAVMGPIQLEILKEIILTRHQIHVDFGPCQIIYAETVKENVIGSGHYEPLGHYAEVHLELSPTKRGSGIQFESNIHPDVLAISYQNLVKTHVYEKEHIGILTGSPLTDVKISLIAGAAHQKHTSGGDFREATFRAVRQALEKASNILLEPYYDVQIEVELCLMGKVLTDIQKACGTFSSPITSDLTCVIKGVVPVATFMNYPIEFMSFTKGKGKISLNVKGYDLCHNAEEVISNKAYDKDSDRENVSASIFCAKGSGFIVPWDEVNQFMHCLK